MKRIIAVAIIAVVAATLSGCSIFEAAPGGRAHFVPGYDYDSIDDGELEIAPNGIRNPF